MSTKDKAMLVFYLVFPIKMILMFVWLLIVILSIPFQIFEYLKMELKDWLEYLDEMPVLKSIPVSVYNSYIRKHAKEKATIDYEEE